MKYSTKKDELYKCWILIFLCPFTGYGLIHLIDSFIAKARNEVAYPNSSIYAIIGINLVQLFLEVIGARSTKVVIAAYTWFAIIWMSIKIFLDDNQSIVSAILSALIIAICLIVMGCWIDIPRAAVREKKRRRKKANTTSEAHTHGKEVDS